MRKIIRNRCELKLFRSDNAKADVIICHEFSWALEVLNQAQQQTKSLQKWKIIENNNSKFTARITKNKKFHCQYTASCIEAINKNQTKLFRIVQKIITCETRFRMNSIDCQCIQNNNKLPKDIPLAKAVNIFKTNCTFLFLSRNSFALEINVGASECYF